MASTAKFTLRWLCLVLVGGSVAGCTGDPPDDPSRTEASTEFEPNKQVFAAIAKADHLTLYEGLPRLAAEELEREKREKATVTIHGFPFYAAALEVAAEDVARLKGALGAEASFRPWEGEKKCGGFHPDYLAEWRVGKANYRVLICFGCEEVKVFGPKHTLRADLDREMKSTLKGILIKYRKNSPEGSVR